MSATLATPAVCAGSRDLLNAVWDEERALFPYTSRIVDGAYVSEYAHPLARRYTINSLLGLQAAGEPWAARTTEFLSRHYDAIGSRADLGLLLVLLRAAAPDDALQRVREASRHARSFNMQDLGWLIWGATAAGETDAARALLDVLLDDFVHPRSGLPRHTLGRGRSHVVSFGSCVYYLRALHEAARVLGDPRAERLFRNGVGRLIDAQGPQGEWPWMISVATGRPFDLYPVFSVHQHSMAMLFLLPALDAGEERAGDAIKRSWQWLLGSNDLGTRMVVDEPFLIYRSIERRDRLPRLRRYWRSFHADGTPAPSSSLRINTESRSYEHGWILFAWSGREDVPAL